jgi:hypothetical protein
MPRRPLGRLDNGGRRGAIRSEEFRDSSHAEMRKRTSFCWGGESEVVGVSPRPPKSVPFVHRVVTSVRVWASWGWSVWRASMTGSRLLSVPKGIEWSFARERQPIDF